MTSAHRVLLAGAMLIGTSLSAEAQGTYAPTARSGYGSSNSNTSNAFHPSSTPSSFASQAPRNLGTGQGRTEGAMGLSPQLQREMGISRQQ